MPDFGNPSFAGVSIGQRPISSLWQLAGWQGFDDAVLPVLDRLGLGPVMDFRMSVETDSCTAWRVAPDRILIEGCEDPGVEGNRDLVALDLGHARTAITLVGPAARDVLMQVCAIDCAPDVFAPSEFRQTGIHHVGVLIQCTGAESFDILVPCTWATSVQEVLALNSARFGI